MSDSLVEIYESSLHPQTKLLYGILRAYWTEEGHNTMNEHHIAAILRISTNRLRAYRSELNSSGYCTVKKTGDALYFQIRNDRSTRESDRSTRESDRKAIKKTHIRNEGVSDIFNSTLLDKNSFIHSFDKDEQKASIAILTDPLILMSNNKATELSTAYSFETIRAYCCNFVAANKSPDIEAGHIAYSLKSKPIPALVHNQLWARHMTAEEISAQTAAEAAAAAENAAWAARQTAAQAERLTAPAPESEPEPTVKSAEDIWASAKDELQAALPAATFAMWINDTHALAYNDGEFVIGVPTAYAREWLQNRLRLQIKRILGRLAGRAVDVTFQVRTHAQMEAPHG